VLAFVQIKNEARPSTDLESAQLLFLLFFMNIKY